MSYNNYNNNPRSQNPYHNNRQIPQQNINQRFGGFDPFSDFERMINMDNFDDPFDDRFMLNPFQHFRNFLDDGRGVGNGPTFDIEQQGQRFGPNNCTMITKSYVTKMDYSDGTPHQETYKSQSIRHTGQDGKKIQEKQEAYKNSKTGVERAGFQRTLDDRGQKCIKERNTITGQQDSHVLYKGMQESDLDNFNQEYGQYRQQVNFQKNYDYLASMNDRMKRLGDGRNTNNNYGNNGRGNQQPHLGLPSGYERDAPSTPYQDQFHDQMYPQSQQPQSQTQQQYPQRQSPVPTPQRGGNSMNNPGNFYGRSKYNQYGH